jgi:hypothetical protein
VSSNREVRISQLKAAASRKREDAIARANRALVSLESRGRPINFTSVSLEAAVSKDFLYKNQALRRIIVLKRGPGRPALSAIRSSGANASAVKLTVATEALRQLRRENQALAAENARLRGDLQALRQRYAI